MDYEKKYKETLERAKEIKSKILYSHLSTESCKAVSEYIDTIIPELTESEDERIRKFLVEIFSHGIWQKEWPFGPNEVVAWLEKQKEQKPNIEICPHSIKSKSYKENGYLIENCDYGLEIALSILEKTLGKVQGYQTDDGIREHQTAIKAVKDVMKEQKPAEWNDSFEENIRNLLHDKLTGHSEDGKMSSTVFIDDKTLKDIINGIWFYVGKEALKYPNKELNVPEWSEKRKKELRDYLFNMIKLVHTGAEKLRYTNDELEKYVEKCTQDILDLCPISQQPKQEWSEEDEKIAKEIEEELWYPGDFPDYPSKEESELYDDCQKRLGWFKNRLKSLRNGIFQNGNTHWKPSEEQKKRDGNDDYNKGYIKGRADTLKEFDDMPSWKPSEEQMDALERASTNKYLSAKQFDILVSLYEQLKKLM